MMLVLVKMILIPFNRDMVNGKARSLSALRLRVAGRFFDPIDVQIPLSYTNPFGYTSPNDKPNQTPLANIRHHGDARTLDQRSRHHPSNRRAKFTHEGGT
jgi:hypothetical protein